MYFVKLIALQFVSSHNLCRREKYWQDLWRELAFKIMQLQPWKNLQAWPQTLEDKYATVKQLSIAFGSRNSECTGMDYENRNIHKG